MYIIIHIKPRFIVKKTLHLAKERRFNINYEYEIPLVVFPFSPFLLILYGKITPPRLMLFFILIT